MSPLGNLIQQMGNYVNDYSHIWMTKSGKHSALCFLPCLFPFRW